MSGAPLRKVLVCADFSTTAARRDQLLSLARSLLEGQAPDPQISLLCLGESAAGLARDHTGRGVCTVFGFSSVSRAGEYAVVPEAQALAAAIDASGAEVVLLEDSHRGRDIAAYAAALVDGALVCGVLGFEGVTAVKLALGNSFMVRVSGRPGRVLLATVKTPATVEPSAAPPGVGEPASPLEGVGVPQACELDIASPAPAARVIRREPLGVGGRPALTEAEVVVAGGRGTNGDFGPVEELADVLGAAVGASRVATDEGWIDHSAQVGQTGVTVSPRLYISAGISGALQQKTGMQGSEVIVAVNSDPDAPVFEIADFGVVGDLFEVLPQAAAEIRRRRCGA